MTNTIEGGFHGQGKRFAIVSSRWNSFFSEQLLSGAIDTLVRHGVDKDDITVVRCPGCFELPMTAARVKRTLKVDAIICLGVLIRGSTPHFDYIAAEATKGIGQLAMDGEVPLSFGVITCDSLDQAVERSGSKVGNKGVEAAMAALEMVNLYDALSG
ncbi:6,7-dimethyl-8-ribityllumazine synthase [Lujinxingia vulgaris]|uniref:6,7-dimethyl-8-ribityllumazine synthase n=1 Tax=Lujinxingia vulgaris TaxID=2600176 RepID=A0A5C6X946_9DELT|nr:6,7-dimethyl-8-ribityllumazine synthase [Lujinxingia vulgaris]TXD36875.1 6,7-dimethyl-8-ribityllumazine synthase [Lujinxingia vulgaris]TXD39081.1 6,7-dimethyl-8-ribityllumazine synthase [Lujinxingia vulgaris]